MSHYPKRLFQISFPILTFISVIILIPSGQTKAQVDFSGYARNYNAVQTRPDHQVLIGRNRFRLDLSRSIDTGEIQISNDIRNLYSASADSFIYRLREAYIDLYFPKSDLRLGRQLLVWGRAEGAFITDILTPMDLTEFLTQDFSDIRIGVTSLSFTRYFGSDYLQLVVNPVFNANQIAELGTRWFPRPILPTAFPVKSVENNPEPNLGNVQLAARWAFRSNIHFDLDLGALYWHYPSPLYFKDLDTDTATPEVILQESFSQSIILFYSGTISLTDKLLLTSEAAYYDTRQFDYLSEELRSINLQNPSPAEQIQLAQIFNTNRDGFLKKRPWLISMIGLEFELADWTLSSQIINEHIFNFDNTIVQEQDYTYVTLRTDRSFARDKFSFSTFSRYNFSGDDFWINPEMSYDGIDSFRASVGTQLFGGKQPDRFFGHLSFKNFASNSFAYLRVTAYF